MVTHQGQKHEVLFSHEKQDMDLRSLADWVIRPRLLKLPGIAEITAMGGNRKQYQVLLDPDAMAQYGVTLDEVDWLCARTISTPAAAWPSGQAWSNPSASLAGSSRNSDKVLEELRRLPVKQTVQRTILIEQVASRVVEGSQFRRGDANINGLPGVLITVRKQLNTDTAP